MRKEKLKKLNIPNKPGVYFFKKGKDILYIGKATSLKDRIKSYFNEDLIKTRGPLLVDLIFKTDKVDWKETDSVLEALILEAVLIKKYQPKYNTKEKSDKSFNYVCITDDKLPKILIIRGRDIINKKISFKNTFGPFTNGGQLKEALKIVRRIFPFLDEKVNSYKFYKQLDLVPDVSNKEGIKKYKNDIKNLILFFEGNKKNVVSNLNKEMIFYAKNREFERAGEVKKQLFALQHINDVALIKNNSFSDIKISSSEKLFRIEAYDIAHMSGKNMVGVMVVIENGEIEKSEYRKFSARGGSAFGGKTILGDSSSNDVGALKEVLERRLAHTEWAFPSLIVVDGGIAQINITKAVLTKMGSKIEVVSVLKDERHKAKAILFPPPSRPDLKGAQGLAFIKKYKKEILLANSEAHRFAINYHKNMRNRNFLK
ncbi:MAG: excinuclease ABC subunit C [Candidatus Nomurabacteria bacterium GW2011_GWE1_32_28]|uniref:Excinuclease ABC subunit C n=1 Tax=Candidatus Nomurabacteria bacterium GW2011_GWF1_31_48 TaxID=1618767 RepID=A0A0G0AUL4_9BACT|nr:MAG: excinuclease ABC subunit C [Candidatus Nomurabacteria bacterium GW2011_GWF2_30_133]KKP28772.1 MAG: excinuclease ABC subunit C [Candidatus Nomurabacteria bacterium GW2011_GWE2_31_40]KKP30350.1 MAG: excinuclease ABC subunit C [Candidatus Nomurabacteria bacterium GW2011_GWF1_31_48]KKP34877.1 MAG: excinuclease ABC subunit C [Candidatus Nomurabacteria bacterium GW2011_GWE1_32_28]HAS80968.1 hypothetical protein [Candidatus Nomurabacteria bacterium]